MPLNDDLLYWIKKKKRFQLQKISKVSTSGLRSHNEAVKRVTTLDQVCSHHTSISL